ncbi:hypothetical protein GCM10011579_066220 [Streptomyces albiflavescens]|uniref:Uncharacterized protein n=1 Tax=Streptomyces albiflavescens TaxID=1623582 RepID=A0A917YAD2_9ACTN|nr:hypothetical protein GCM10011579_066220 [Streptomyces albiflavescens]
MAADADDTLRALAERASTAVVRVPRNAAERARDCLDIRGDHSLSLEADGGGVFAFMNNECIHGAVVIGNLKV